MTATTALTLPDDARLAALAAAADYHAAQHVDADDQRRKRATTLTAYLSDLGLFGMFLAAAGVDLRGAAHTYAPGVSERAALGHYLRDHTAIWARVSPGLVTAWREWMLAQGYAVRSVNRRLSAVRQRVRLAHLAGAIDADAYSRIMALRGYGQREARSVDAGRDLARVGAKKSEPVLLSLVQARRLKHDHTDTPAGRRDRLIMALLLDHGLRVGELALLGPANIEGGELVFYRPKVDVTTRHTLSADTLAALAGAALPLGLTVRSLTRRVATLGAGIGVDGLSAHDCRHYCATNMARAGTPIDAMLNFFGWTSAATAMRYVHLTANASDGVRQVF